MNLAKDIDPSAVGSLKSFDAHRCCMYVHERSADWSSHELCMITQVLQLVLHVTYNPHS